MRLDQLVTQAGGGGGAVLQPGSFIYDIYRDGGSIKLLRQSDALVLGSWGEAGAALTALLAEGDIPLTCVVHGRGGLLPITTQPVLPAGRTYSPMFVGDTLGAGFQCSTTAPKPFSIANGTLATPLTYRMPCYRGMSFDASADTWAGPKDIGFFGKDKSQSYILFADVPEYRDLYLRCGKSFNTLEGEGSTFGWWDWQVSVGATYDPATAPWWTSATPSLRTIRGPLAGGAAGGTIFRRATVEWGQHNGRMANILFTGYRAIDVEWDTGSIPNVTDGAAIFDGGRGFPIGEISIISCRFWGVGDSVVELDQAENAVILDLYSEDGHVPLLWNNFGNLHHPGQQSCYVEGLMAVTNQQTRETKGITVSSYPGVTDMGNLVVRGFTRKYRTATMPRATRSAVHIKPNCAADKVDIEVDIEESGWTWDGSGSGVNSRDQVKIMGGGSSDPNNIRVKVRHKVRGTVNNTGGAAALLLTGVVTTSNFYGKADIDYFGDVQIGGLGIGNGNFRPVYHGRGGGPTQGQIDEADIDATAGSWTYTVGANTTAALAYNITEAALQTAVQGLASVGGGNATVSLGDQVGNLRPYTITFASSLGALTTTLNPAGLTGSGILIHDTPYGSSSNEYGQTVVSWAKGSSGIPQTNIEQWDASVNLVDRYVSAGWNTTYAPAGSTAQKFLGSRPPGLELDVSAGGAAVLLVGRQFGTNNCTMTAAGDLVGFEFEVPDTTPLTQASFNVGVQSGNMEVVILDIADGYRRIATTGSFAMPATGPASQAYTAGLTLRRGRYFQAWLCDNTTGALVGSTAGVPDGVCRRLASVGIPCPVLPGTPATNSAKAPTLFSRP